MSTQDWSFQPQKLAEMTNSLAMFIQLIGCPYNSQFIAQNNQSMLVNYMTNSLDCKTPKISWSFASIDLVKMAKHFLTNQIGYSNNQSVFRMKSFISSNSRVESVCRVFPKRMCIIHFKIKSCSVVQYLTPNINFCECVKLAVVFQAVWSVRVTYLNKILYFKQ